LDGCLPSLAPPSPRTPRPCARPPSLYPHPCSPRRRHAYTQDSIAALATAAGAALPLFWVWMYRSCTLTMNGLNLYWFEKMVRAALDMGKGGGGKKKAAAAAAAARKPKDT
jgi:hypothetical protein